MEEESQVEEPAVPEKEGKDKKRIMLAVILTVAIILSTLGGVLLLIRPSGDGEGERTYIGAVIPSEYVGSSTNGGEADYFVGYRSDRSANDILTFELTGATGFQDITGGEFEISGNGGAFELSRVVSSDTYVVGVEELETTINNLFVNVEVTYTSLSLVYSNYTFGIGTTGTEDYIWVAPEKSYPTFFNTVEVKGTIFDSTALEVLAEDYADSVFDAVELGKIGELAQEFGFTFNGINTKFIMVSEMIYMNPLSIRGDVIDTITPSDVERLAASFSTDGTEWLKGVVSGIGEGVAILTEEDNVVDDTRLWLLVYSLSDYSDFRGICQLEVYESDMSNLTGKVNSLVTSSFDVNLDFSFEVRVGIIGDASSDIYEKRSVTGLWQSINNPHSKTLVESSEVEGYGIVVDLSTLIQSLGEALELPESTMNALKTITTFRNPAFVLLLDESLPEMLYGAGTPAWEYCSVAVISDYEVTASGFRYLNLKGVLYDPALYFGASSSLSHIPLLVVDTYSEVTEGLQVLTVKDLKEGNVAVNQYGWAYVDIDSITVGTTLKTIADQMSSHPAAKAVKAFPLDLCAYYGFKVDGLTEIYQVPIIYIAAGQGPTYYGYNTTSIRGMYVDFATNLNSINSFLESKVGLNAPLLDDLLPYISELSNLTESMTVFVDDLLTSGLFPPGYILAFSVEDIVNVPPTLTLVAPIMNDVVPFDDFNITVQSHDDPDMALWVEIRTLRDGLNIFAGSDIPIPAPILKNGVWSTNDPLNSWWWEFVKIYIKSFDPLLLGSYTVEVEVHDFYGYSVEITRDFTFSSSGPDSQKPDSILYMLPVYSSTVVFWIDADATDDVAVDAVELWYEKDAGPWAFYDNDTFGLDGWGWIFDSGTTGGDGVYSFYSRAVDTSGNYEDSPTGNDTWSFVETYNPIAEATGPGTVSTLTFDVSYSLSDSAPSSGIGRVTLWYTLNNGFTWSEYGDDVDITSPMQVTVSGAGNYGWFFVAEDNAGNFESDPIGLWVNLPEFTTYVDVDSADNFVGATEVVDSVIWTEDLGGVDADDFFKIWLKVGEILLVTMIGDLPTDFDLYLYDPSQTLIDSSATMGSTESVGCVAAVEGFYYVDVNDWGGVSGSYTLSFFVT